MTYYDPELSGVGDWVRSIVSPSKRDRTTTIKAGAVDRAKKILLLLQDAISKWDATDRIRSGLPAKYARMIPPSRLRVVKGILGHFMRAGAVTPRSNVAGLGFDPLTVTVIGIGTVALVGTAAAVAVVAAMGARIVKEHRLAKDATGKADLALAAFNQSKADTAAYGPAAAADLLQIRTAAAGSILTTPPPAMDDDGWQLPWWVLPTGIGIGALALFGGQKYTGRRR